MFNENDFKAQLRSEKNLKRQLREAREREATATTSLSELYNLTTDELLDIYNDYQDLYKNFGDLAYKQHADKVMALIKGKYINSKHRAS